VASNGIRLAYQSILDPTRQFSILSLKSKGIAYQLWPASTFLCQYIETNKESLFTFSQDMIPLCLELGAGCALVSMVCASLGCCSIATDLPEVAPHIAANIMLNQQYYSIASPNDVLRKHLETKTVQQGQIAVDCLSWGEECARFADAQFDVILVADCVYWEELFAPLLSSLLHLTSNSPQTIILLSQTVRRQHIEKRFFKRLHANFVVDMVSDQKLDGERTRIYKAQRRFKT
jgi:predicted nicotinamide N-methyase